MNQSSVNQLEITSSPAQKITREQPFRSRALAREQNPHEEIHVPLAMTPMAYVIPWVVCIFAWFFGLACIYDFIIQLDNAWTVSAEWMM